MKIYDALQARGGIRPRTALPEPLPVAKREADTPSSTKLASQAIPAEKRGLLPRMDLLGLFQSVQGMLDDGSPRTLQFMSATPGEGTSTITREFAATVAESAGLRVLLVTTKRGNHGPASRLSGTLLGNDPLDAVLTRVPGELYLTAEIGAIAEQNSHSFLAQRMPDLLERLLARVDLIIIDSSPVLTEHAGLATVRYVGGVVLVVEAERTRSSTVNYARQMIEANGGRILGAVLNKRRSQIPRLLSRWL